MTAEQFRELVDEYNRQEEAQRWRLESLYKALAAAPGGEKHIAFSHQQGGPAGERWGANAVQDASENGLRIGAQAHVDRMMSYVVSFDYRASESE